MRELEILAAAGRGRMTYDSLDSEFGSGIWSYVGRYREIQLFERGLLYREVGSSIRRISLIEVGEVVSGLSAKVISEASQKNEAEMIVPLQLNVGREPIVLGIPLIVYSGLLIAIQAISQTGQVRHSGG